MPRNINDNMVIAPRDKVIEVRHGPLQEITAAYWSKRFEAWVREGDDQGRVLHRVTGWRLIRDAED